MTFTPPNSHSNGLPLGLTGATAATRYVGATSSGAPATGTFAVGDWIVDQSGAVYICTVAGSPGTWVAIGSGAVAADGWTAAGETWTYASADAPTFTFTIAADVTTKYAVGQRIKLTQTTAKYFIITAVSTFSGGNTTITVYGGTDYTLVNAAITLPFWSMAKAPFGFPLDPAKWTVETSDTSQRTQGSPVSGTWYNLGAVTIVVPIGCWRLYYEVNLQVVNSGSSASVSVYSTLSTANNTESDKGFTASVQAGDAAAAGKTASQLVHRENILTLAAKASRFLNAMSDTSPTNIYFQNAIGTCYIRAVCAYL